MSKKLIYFLLAALVPASAFAVTFTGNETPTQYIDKLNQIGAATGGTIEVQDESIALTVNVTKLDFSGAGVVVTEPSPDEMLITIPGGGGGAVDSVNGQTGVVVVDADDVSDSATTNKYTTAAEISKLAGIEAGSDITDAANVTSAGALMDSEVDADIKTLGITAGASVANGNTGDQTITLTGDVTGSGSGSFAATIAGGAVGASEIAATTVSAGSYTCSDVTVDADGRLTSAASGSCGGGGGDVAVDDEGVLLTAAVESIDFVGSGVTVTEPTANQIVVTIASGGAPVDSVNGQTGTVVLDADDVSDAATTNKYTTAGDISKLAGIEAGADITDAANVTSAGALMDSEVDADIKTLVITAGASVSNGNTGDQTITLTGDVTGSGTGSFAVAIAGDAVGMAEIDSAACGTSEIWEDQGATFACISTPVDTDTNLTDTEVEAAYNARVAVVSQVDAEAGTSVAVKRWTAERVKQAINALAGGGGDMQSDGSVQMTAGLTFDEATATPLVSVEGRTTDAATGTFYIIGQNAFGSASTNINGGQLLLVGGDTTVATGTTGAVTGITAAHETGGNTGAFNFSTGTANGSGNTGNVSFSTGTVVDGTAGNISFSAGAASGTGSGGAVFLNSIAYPAADGSDGQTMITNGAGVISFSDPVRTQSEPWTVEAPSAATVSKPRAATELTLTRLDCSTTGATAPSLTVRIQECNASGASCVDSGLEVALTTAATNESDTTVTNATIEAGNRWGLYISTFTTAPEVLDCSATYTTSG